MEYRSISSNRGFSLIEMGVVLVIIGAILSFSIGYLNDNLQRSEIKKTYHSISKIEDAITSYADAHGYLPCPAKTDANIASTDYGVATDCNGASTGTTETSSGSHTIRIGVTPTRTLGLKDEDMLDAWGNRISYAVITDLAYDRTIFNDFTTSSDDGVIVINDANGNQITGVSSSLCDGSTDTDKCPVVAYVLYSHGKDERAAYNRDGDDDYEVCGSTKKDSENCDNDAIFISTPLNDGIIPANYYDDIISWKLMSQVRSLEFLEARINYNLPTPFFTFTTTSSSASFDPVAITFPSSDLVWTCTNCDPVTTGTGNTPNLDLSGGSNPAEKNIKVESVNKFAGMTKLDMGGLDITSFFGSSSEALGYITELYMDNCQISSLGNGVGHIGTLGAGLYRIYFNNNEFTSLPTTIGNWAFSGHSASALRLDYNDLASLPDEIGDITGLAGSLYIGYQGASGARTLTSLPTTIGGLTDVTQFYASNNGLTSLPSEIGDIGSTGAGLYRIYFNNNELTSLPTTIGNWAFSGHSASALRLDYNDLASLPDEIGDITGLAGSLYIGYQGASGARTLTSLPTTIGGLTDVTQFYASNNGLTSLPSEIGDIGSTGAGLYRIYFNNNELTSLPTTIGNWAFSGHSASALRLDYNDLASLPDEIGDITGLAGSLYIGYQGASGARTLTSLPTTIGGLTDVTQFYASNNGLTSLPSEIGDIGSTGAGLYRIYFNNNELTSLPTTIGNWAFSGHSASALRLDYNDLASLPDEIGDITGLAGSLYIGYQGASGARTLTSLPTTIGGLTDVTQFYANYAGLTSLPSEIGDIGSTGAGLYRVRFDSNELTSLPTTIGNWVFNGHTATYLYFYDNLLTSLPDEIGDITGLDGTLSLYDNQLTDANFTSWINGLWTNRATNFCNQTDTPIIDFNDDVTATTNLISKQAYSQIEGTCTYIGSGNYLEDTGCSFDNRYTDPGC